MKSIGYKNLIWAIILIGFLAGFVWAISSKIQQYNNKEKGNRASKPVPVEVAEIQIGTISLQRTFSGELKAWAKLVVAPKVGGRVERVLVNIADKVERDQVVAELDDDEYVQAIAQAKADLAVAKANLSEARSALEIANREYKRSESLRNRGITADSDFDVASQNKLARQAQLDVAKAQLNRAESSLEIANIRLGYTKVRATWFDGSKQRVVAERYVDEGQTVAANIPLLHIVELNPIVGVVYVTEKDYTRLKPGQQVVLTMEAYPGEQYLGRIARVAPVFNKSSRQARVEMIINNPQSHLKPGMFIRATVVLDQVSGATIVPAQAVTLRNDRSGVFIVSEDRRFVTWHEVEVGIRDGNRIQLKGQGLSGRVVTLGQQLVKDGSEITIPDERYKQVIGHKKETAQ
jgi:RND family efflux transporter MFP subunit